MKSYCIIVIIYKEKPGLRIPFILDLGKVTCMLQGQENNERVPQHTYIMPGLSCSHSVLGSQQWAGYLGTWRFPPKSAWVPSCQESMENRGRGQSGGTAIARRGCVGCVPSLGDFQGQDSWDVSDVPALFQETEKSSSHIPSEPRHLALCSLQKRHCWRDS